MASASNSASTRPRILCRRSSSAAPLDLLSDRPGICWAGLGAANETQLPAFGRLHARASQGQSARRGAEGRRPARQPDAGHRPRVQPLRDGVHLSPAAGAAHRFGPHLHARSSSCRLPAIRRSVPPWRSGCRSRASAIRLEEKVGVITCVIERIDKHVGQARFALPRAAGRGGQAPPAHRHRRLRSGSTRRISAAAS